MGYSGGMTMSDAVKSASIAASQAVTAVNTVQGKVGLPTPQDRYDEHLALAVSNLAIAVKQLAEEIGRR